MDIRYLGEDQHEIHLKSNLMLEGIGEQNHDARIHGTRGGGSHTERQFLISPPLPDTLEQLEFSLIPSAMFIENKIREVVLD
ncbi:hypothetical protein COLU111180_10615 [Cohnella lubricantis]